MLIAWYQIDWAVQDLADFARRVLLDPAAGPATRARALELVESIFEPGGEVAMAIGRRRRVPSRLTGRARPGGPSARRANDSQLS